MYEQNQKRINDLYSIQTRVNDITLQEHELGFLNF
jgi:hypothetical protein